MLSLVTGGSGPPGDHDGSPMDFSCDTCHAAVSLDEGFFRSVNLRPVAWCRSCWFARHDLPVPAQRVAPEAEQRPRRSFLFRR